MDDLFFTDNNNKKNNNRKSQSGRSSRDEFITGSDYTDDFIDTEPGSTPKQRFSVNIPDDEYPMQNDYDIYSQRPTAPQQRTPKSRTPQGKPVSQDYRSSTSDLPFYSDDISSSNQSRTPQVRPVSQGSASNNPTSAGTPVPVKRPNYFADNSQGGKKKKKRKKKGSSGKKIAAAIFAIIFVCLVGLFAYGYSILGKINYDTSTLKENQYISSSELASDSKVRNILFIGSDYRAGEVSGMRSDTMMLFSIDTAHQKLKLTSFLRDSYVYIPTLKKNRKLNAACSSGGAQLVLDTIEYNFKVKIDNYILVDFEAFQKLIDLMGGLTVEGVTAKEAKYLRDTVKITYAKEGTNKFSGAAALWYCRIRYLDDDFHRTERQRKVISAIIDQLKHTSPAKLMDIMQEVLPMITTDISRNELLSLGMGAVTKYLRYDTEQHQVPAKDTWSNR
ncbi:MAG: LCP family protein, partial [Ruminococcus sp.]|nr:LCP family protein [Ruminococcus sp.]